MLNGYIKKIIKFVTNLGYFLFGATGLLLILLGKFFCFVFKRSLAFKSEFLEFFRLLIKYFLRKSRSFVFGFSEAFYNLLLLLIKFLNSLLRSLLFIFKLPFYALKKLFRSSVWNKGLVFLSGCMFAFLFIFLPYEIYVLAQDLPSTDLLIENENHRSTKILDRNGNLLYEIYEDRKYEPVVLGQIPQQVLDATLAIEDDRFYEHRGFRVDSMFRALKALAFDNQLQGASTITQQLVKNVLLTPERTISRKFKELTLAVLVEHKYSKDQILELYLNNISYGGAAWGVGAASQKFFGKHVWELDLAETSMLAGLPSAPSVYSPLNKNALPAKQRQRRVLERMVTLGYISQVCADEAYMEELVYAPQEAYIRAPHFVEYVRALLEEKYGSRFVTFGGLTVKTSLSLDLQEEVQEIVTFGVEKNAYLNLTNGASVVLNVGSGEILAYVGSVDFFREGWGAYDVVRADRQPGSSLKPVTYALALSDGLTPATIIKDSPISIHIPGQKNYSPVNYDGRYHGEVSIRQALANSYNIPAVKVVQSVTPQRMASLAKDMGLASWNLSDPYGLSVTLGGKEVKLLEHTNVYTTFARGGVYKPVQPFLSIRDSKGKELISDWVYEEDRVLDVGVAYLITNILFDNDARSAAFGYRSPLYIPWYQVAAKTGTTDSKKDNWTMGYSPTYAVGVWVGNNDNTPMNSYLASGLTGAAPIWNEIMQVVLEIEDQREFAIPDNVFLKVDEECGRKEYFIKGSNVPNSLCPKEDNVGSEKEKD